MCCTIKKKLKKMGKQKKCIGLNNQNNLLWSAVVYWSIAIKLIASGRMAANRNSL